MDGSARDIGLWGEKIAVDHLRSQGFLIRHVNWRSGRYEIDIVAERGDEMHFVEVKCRVGGQCQSPEEAFDRNKQQSLMKAANAYIEFFGIDMDCMVDLIAIETHRDEPYELRYLQDVMPFCW